VLRDAVLGEVPAATLERLDLVSCVAVTQLFDDRASDETRGTRDQHSHRRRVYWRAFPLLAAGLALAGCQSSKPATPGSQPAPHLTYKALDAQHQRLISSYEPVSRALTAYEIAYRDWHNGRLGTQAMAHRIASFRAVVGSALGRLRQDPATGPTAGGKRLLVAALAARRSALGNPPGSERYRQEWTRSVVDARRALTLLQNIRDRARLIPLPEDSVS